MTHLSHSRTLASVCFLKILPVSLIGQFILCHTNTTLKNKYARNSQVAQWLGYGALTVGSQVHSLVRELRSHKPGGVAKKKKASVVLIILSFLFQIRIVSEWFVGHISSFLGLGIWQKIFLCKKYTPNTLLYQNQFCELAFVIVGHIRKSSHGHMSSVLCISRTAGIPGCDHRFHSGGVGYLDLSQWEVYRDMMLENFRNLATLVEDSFLPECLICSQGFGSCISRMSLGVFCFF